MLIYLFVVFICYVCVEDSWQPFMDLVVNLRGKCLAPEPPHRPEKGMACDGSQWRTNWQFQLEIHPCQRQTNEAQQVVLSPAPHKQGVVLGITHCSPGEVEAGGQEFKANFSIQ